MEAKIPLLRRALCGSGCEFKLITDEALAKFAVPAEFPIAEGEEKSDGCCH
jgi:hypothetical protein